MKIHYVGTVFEMEKKLFLAMLSTITKGVVANYVLDESIGVGYYVNLYFDYSKADDSDHAAINGIRKVFNLREVNERSWY